MAAEFGHAVLELGDGVTEILGGVVFAGGVPFLVVVVPVADYDGSVGLVSVVFVADVEDGCVLGVFADVDADVGDSGVPLFQGDVFAGGVELGWGH